jgi:hypothetical protein
MKNETPDNYIQRNDYTSEPGPPEESIYDSNFPSDDPETVADNATNETREASWLALKARIAHLDEANEQLYAVCKRYKVLLAKTGDTIALNALRQAEEALSVLRSQYENRGEWYEGWATNALPIVREAISELECK